jgi:hypothetical protein
MSEIKAGDLVMVVRPNMCGCPDRIGVPFRVTGIRRVNSIAQCMTCGFEWISGPRVLLDGHKTSTVNILRVIKIDPPAESTGEQDTRRIKETA